MFYIIISKLNFINAVWVGFITWIGADVVYKSLEDKLFSSYKTIDEVIEIRRDDENG